MTDSENNRNAEVAKDLHDFIEAVRKDYARVPTNHAVLMQYPKSVRENIKARMKRAGIEED